MAARQLIAHELACLAIGESGTAARESQDRTQKLLGLRGEKVVSRSYQPFFLIIFDLI
jgi:hypothetical protein